MRRALPIARVVTLTRCRIQMYSWLMAPEALPSGYRRWITNASRVAEPCLPVNLTATRTRTFDPAVARQALTWKSGATPHNALIIQEYARSAEKVRVVVAAEHLLRTQLMARCRRATLDLPLHLVLWYILGLIPVPGRRLIDGRVYSGELIASHAPIIVVADTFLLLLKVDDARLRCIALHPSHGVPQQGFLQRVGCNAHHFRCRVADSCPSSPQRFLTKSALGTLRSSSFLACFVTWFQFLVCTQRNIYYAIHGRVPEWVEKLLLHKGYYWAVGFSTCLSLFIEEKKRRGELAMYVPLLLSAVECRA